jgi:hypothetical protein
VLGAPVTTRDIGASNSLRSNNSLPKLPSPMNDIFPTERLQLAIYLHAAQRLPFQRCEISGSRKVRFVFEDPGNIGPQAELEFDRGAEVSASDLFASQKFLRRRMSEANNIGKTENGNCERPQISNPNLQPPL